MKKRILAILLCMAMVATLFTGCGKKAGGKFDITVWVASEIAELTETQIKNFNETNKDGIEINATVVAVSEADATTQMLTDVEAGADMFCFVQDQFARLVQGGALARLGDKASQFVKENNDEYSVAAVTSGDAIYAYPMTSDNGYFCFYDKRVVSDEQIKTVEGIIEACKASGKTFCFDLENGFYDSGFYFGVGCDSTWVTDDDGKFISVNDTFNSDKGLIAAKGIYKIVSSGVWNGSSEAEQFEAGIPAAVVVTGPWKTEVAQKILGENLGSAKLPTYNIDGTDYQIGSFRGGKMLGLKPQADAERSSALNKLAQYLTGEQCQVERFEAQKFGPSNKKAQANDAIKADPGLSALAAQAPYAKTQCSVHGKWWDMAKAITTAIKDSNGTDSELQAINQAYFDAINAVFNVTQDEAEAFSVIGDINGDGWSVDLPLTRTTETGEATYYSEPIKFVAGNQFKVRQGGGWDVNFGAEGKLNAENNCEATEDGYFFVKFTVNDALTEATITLQKTSFYGWALIGQVNGTNWDTDFEMEIQEDGTTYKLEGVEFAAGAEFKVRTAHDWTVNYGADCAKDGANIVVENAGTYTVTFDSLTGAVTVE